jgi:hypothetical protein
MNQVPTCAGLDAGLDAGLLLWISCKLSSMPGGWMPSSCMGCHPLRAHPEDVIPLVNSGRSMPFPPPCYGLTTGAAQRGPQNHCTEHLAQCFMYSSKVYHCMQTHVWHCLLDTAQQQEQEHVWESTQQLWESMCSVSSRLFPMQGCERVSCWCSVETACLIICVQWPVQWSGYQLSICAQFPVDLLTRA